MHFLLTFFLIIFAFPAQAQFELSVEEAPEPITQEEERRFDFTVDDLEFDCKKCVNFPKGHECVYCNGVLTGASAVMGMLEYGKTFCPPNNLSTDMVRNFFRRWLLREGNRDPSLRGIHAIDGLVRSMRYSFPCEQAPAAAGEAQ